MSSLQKLQLLIKPIVTLLYINEEIQGKQEECGHFSFEPPISMGRLSVCPEPGVFDC